MPAGFEAVAASPEAEAELAARGGSAPSLADYADEKRIQERGAETFDVVDAIAGEIDHIVRRRLPHERVEPARWDYFWMKIAFDAVWLCAAELSALIAARQPETIAFFEGDAGASPIVSLDESVYGAVLPTLGVASLALAAEAPAARVASGRPDLRGLAAAAGLEASGRLLGVPRRSPGSVLCLDFGYSVPPIVHRLLKDGWRVHVWPGGETSRALGSARRRAHPVDAERGGALRDLWQEVERSESIRALFVLGDLDLWPAGSRFLRRLVERSFPESVSRYEQGRAVVRDLRPDVALTSMAAHGTQRAACAAARAEGVPVAVARHGELGIREIPMTVREDVDVVDWALCWGEWERRWVERYARRDVGTRVVGAPMIEEAVRRPLSRRRARRAAGTVESDRVVLFVPTNYSRNHWYGGWRMPTDNVYYREQVGVLSGLVAVEGLRVVIKEHPAAQHSALERWAGHFAPEGKVKVVRTPPFARLIHLADAIVIDAPSTTLVEALFGSAAIYVVDNPVFHWEPGVHEHLQSHGVVICDQHDVAGRVEADLAAGRARHLYTNTAREPLAAGGRGAASRAAAAIAAIARD